MFLPHPRVKVSIVGSLRDREVACSASDRQDSNFESCVWRTVSSQSSHHPQEVLLAQFSLYVHKGGLKPDSFHFYHVTTSPYILIFSTTYYRSTGQHVVKTFRSIPVLQVTMSPPRHISHSLLLPTTGLQVNTSSNPQKHTNTTGHHVTTSPYISFSTATYYRSTGQHVVKTLRINPLLQTTMSPPRHVSYSLLLPTTGPQVDMSSKPKESYSTTGQHVPTSPYISFSTTIYYRSTGQHVVKTLRSIPIPQVTMSPPRHIS